ncbi:BZ3500_MvSof-1268-A1-R1_Chr9g10350 [Microbotryum saponariae]|uniref:BZ3500_MvSof-1268-A1-R1_Chr9g10350 protein n=1 Tax=Microbotryum saponariae TaxID=289078 RepID=A0A2X0L4W7_9BASI|nr:BZ3501_MvSof-1269-A2-R1_Chr9g10100 [Microbotryum saponariae]SCZ99950.1 BZ3500_MvSof-1268-A1-R1_Chr9g10350 [Microbotryum saponariae]
MSNGGAVPGVWRRAGGVTGSSTSNAPTHHHPAPSHGRGSGRGGAATARASGAARGAYSASISSQGFTTARASIGRKVDPMELLQSPSRGLNGQADGVESLQDPSTQENFYDWIRAKIGKFDTTWDAGTSSSGNSKPPHLSPKAQQELGIILLDLRKLREGLTCLRRNDAFALKGMFPIDKFDLGTLPLRFHFRFLSVRNLGPPLPSRIQLVRRRHIYYTSLHLLFLLSSTKTSPTNPSLASQSVSDGRTAPDHLTFWTTWQSLEPQVRRSPWVQGVRQLSGLLLRGDYIGFGRILSSSIQGPSEHPSKTVWDPLQLVLIERFVPFVRTKAWERMSKSYKLKSDLEDWGWLSKVLLFDLEGAEGGQDGKEWCRKWVEDFTRG